MFLYLIIFISIIGYVFLIWEVVAAIRFLLNFFGVKCVFTHDFDGCTCRKCGQVRDTGHVYMRSMYESETKNRPSHCKCGKVCYHPIVRYCRCQTCGVAVHNFVTYDEWWDDTRNMYKWRSRCKDCGKENFG